MCVYVCVIVVTCVRFNYLKSSFKTKKGNNIRCMQTIKISMRVWDCATIYYCPQ